MTTVAIGQTTPAASADHVHAVYEHVNLSFKDLEYTVSTGCRKKEIKTLLKKVSGRFDSGQLIALMGPSGAGKSTLLNVLAGYKTRNFTGEIKVNGADRDLDTFRKLSCYIMQHDELMPHLTVMEAMMVAATLKLTEKIPRKEKLAIVNEIMETMGLSERKEVRVDKLSGGQKKRLSIAQELVNNPPMMFFDEPTSGLDSQTSLQCITVMKNLAKEGRTIICTIHQPSAKLFELFDQLYLLADGVCLFRGPTAAVLPFFASVDLVCPPYHNPADFVIEVSCGMYGDVNGRLGECVRAGKCEELAAIHGLPPAEGAAVEQQPQAESQKTQEKEVSAKSSGKGAKKPKRKRVFAANTFTQFLVLFVRSFKSILRDATLTHLRFMSHAVVGLLIGCLFYNIGQDRTKTRENSGFLFFAMLFLMFTALMPTVMTFPVEMAVFIREHMNSWYSLRSYYFAKVMADLPFQLVFPVVYCSIVYWMTNQPAEGARFLKFILFAILVSLVAQSSGLVISAAVPLQAAVFLGPVTAIPILLFSGFFVGFDTIPSYMQWLSYMSYVRYAFEGTYLSIYGNNRTMLECTNCSEIDKSYADPEQLIKHMDMEDKNLGPNIGILLAFFVIFRILCYGVLHIRVRNLW